MSKTLVVFAAVSGLMMSTALAQAPSGPATAPAVSGSPQVVADRLAEQLDGTRSVGVGRSAHVALLFTSKVEQGTFEVLLPAPETEPVRQRS